MTKFSSSSRRSGPHFFLYFLLVAAIGVAAVNLAGTLVLQKAFRLTSRQMVSLTEASLTARAAYFNIFRGATFSGLELRKDQDVLFAAGRLDIGFHGASFINKKVKVKTLRLTKSFLATGKFPETLRVLQMFLGGGAAPTDFYETVFFQAKDTALDTTLTGDLSGYVNSLKGTLWTSRGTILIKKIRFPAIPEVDFFEGSHFYKPFDFMLEVSSADGDLKISRCELSNPRVKFTGSGGIVRDGQQSRVNLEIDFPNILLEDFPALNPPQVRSRGVLDGAFRIMGPFEKAQPVLNLSLSQGEFTFFNALLLSKVRGQAVMTPERFFGQGFSLNFNGVPLSADFSIYMQRYLHLLLRLASVQKSAGDPAFDGTLSADWRQGYLGGEARGSLRYSTQQFFNTMMFHFRDFRLGYDEDIFFFAKNLDSGFSVESGPEKERKKVFDRQIALENLFGVLRTSEDGFVFDHIKASCYDGTLEGNIFFAPERDVLGVKGEVHLREVNLRRFSRESRKPPSLKKGKLDGDLRFDNRLVDQLKGQIFIVNGEIDEDPIVNGVASFLGIGSLKKITFGDLSAFFNGGRGNYGLQLKLTSSLVSGHLDGKVVNYEKMDGYLSVSLATQLLNESRTFKKLLTYLKHDQPSVEFPFKISGYLNSPRVLSLGNEFKEKLEKILPERNKRYLQSLVNSILEKSQ